jgi:hypothetical protein
VLHGDITGAADMETLAETGARRRAGSFRAGGPVHGRDRGDGGDPPGAGRVTRLALLDTNPRAELPEVKARRAPADRGKVRAGGLER